MDKSMGRVLLISKDVLRCAYLPGYGQKEFPMPNITELAVKGTVFRRHYTAAPSTAMAFTSMFTGKYPYQTDRKKYVEVSEYEGVTLFDKFHDMGCEVRVLWDQRYVYLAQRYSKCYGKDTIIDSVDWLTKDISPHKMGEFDDLSYRPQYTEHLIEEMKKYLENTVKPVENMFLWVHLPHVLAGRNSYGSDMDVFDQIVGYFREYFDDENIFITADHGHMNGTHGKYGYGFDVNEEAIRIPFITPKLDNSSTIDFPTSNIQISDIILKRTVNRLQYVISETAYYGQPHRKMAIIKDQYKYIYEKIGGKRSLFDLEFDYAENNNLAFPEIFDVDRKRKFSINQRFYYRKWDEAHKVFEELDQIKNELWRNPPWYIDAYNKFLYLAKRTAIKILNK